MKLFLYLDGEFFDFAEVRVKDGGDIDHVLVDDMVFSNLPRFQEYETKLAYSDGELVEAAADAWLIFNIRVQRFDEPRELVFTDESFPKVPLIDFMQVIIDDSIREKAASNLTGDPNG